MKLGETVYFNNKKYQENISKKGFSYSELAKEIYRKRAKGLSSKVRTGALILAAPVTHGGSLVAAAISRRNVSVEKQKLKLLEDEWERRGQRKLPTRMVEDIIIPITLAVGTSLFTIGIDLALAGAAPDQFSQTTPEVDLNGFLISNFNIYYN